MKRYRKRFAFLFVLGMIVILSACSVEKQSGENNEANSTIQTSETVTVTRGTLTPTVSAQTTIIQASDFVLSSTEKGVFETCVTSGDKITAGGVIGKVSENEIKSPVDGTVISATNSSEIIPNNYPVATVRYTGFALNVEAENFLKTLPENTTLKAKFQVINGVGPTDILAVVTPATEYAEGSSTNTLFPQSNVLQCLIDKDTDVKIGQNATVVITAGTKENILLLPLSVIAGRQGRGMVTVIKDGEQIQTEVTLGATDGAYIEILSGVEEGDVVSSVPPNLDPRSNS